MYIALKSGHIQDGHESFTPRGTSGERGPADRSRTEDSNKVLFQTKGPRGLSCNGDSWADSHNMSYRKSMSGV